MTLDDLTRLCSFIGEDVNFRELDFALRGVDNNLAKVLRDNGGMCTYGSLFLERKKGSAFWDVSVRRARLEDISMPWASDIIVTEHAIDRYILRVLRIKGDEEAALYKYNNRAECVKAIRELLVHGKVVYEGEDVHGEQTRYITVYRGGDFLLVTSEGHVITLYRYSAWSPYNWKKPPQERKPQRFQIKPLRTVPGQLLPLDDISVGDDL